MAVHLLTLVAILPPLALDRLITGRIRGIFDFPITHWTAKGTASGQRAYSVT